MNKLIHWIRMRFNITYRLTEERHQRYAKIMAANKSIMIGK
jgi:hypothetical protein